MTKHKPKDDLWFERLLINAALAADDKRAKLKFEADERRVALRNKSVAGGDTTRDNSKSPTDAALMDCIDKELAHARRLGRVRVTNTYLASRAMARFGCKLGRLPQRIGKLRKK